MLYVGRWEWDGVRGRWRAPGGTARGVIDLRTLPQQATVGGAGGAGLFEYEAPTSHANLSIELGESIESRSLTDVEKGAIRDVLGMPADTPMHTNARRALQQWLTDPAYTDPTGQARPKPFRANLRTRGVRASIGSAMIFRERVTDEHPAFISCLDVFRADYIRHRQVLGTPERVLRRWTGYQMRAMYGRMTDADARILLPESYKGDGWERPQTTLTESFNKADAATLGPDLSWTQFYTSVGGSLGVTSNQAHEQTNDAFSEAECRADTDLSSDDHYAQAVYGANWTGGLVGVLCRKDSTATHTHYLWRHYFANDVWLLEKRVGGVETTLDENYHGDGAVGQSFRISADGSTIKGFHQGVERASVTDTIITGNLRCGIHIVSTVGTQAYLDNFEAGDLVGDTPDRYGGAAYYRTRRRILPL